ncbi:MAG: hypothetical protein K8F24_01580, partial [Bacteroidales bacterium]|nr:hypothetical protein [Bacteroidales bacterium]
LAKVIRKKLQAANIETPAVNGAFYLFPDFSFYREKLKARNILTSSEICDALLDETGVAMLPAIDFGHQPEELMARMAYVDFDGKLVLEQLQAYDDKKLDEDFIKQNCPAIWDGVEAMTEWFKAL